MKAYKAFAKVANLVDPILEAALAKSILGDLDYELLYVPVVMPIEWHDEYTESSRLLKKKRTYNCSPQLDYEAFLKGHFED